MRIHTLILLFALAISLLGAGCKGGGNTGDGTHPHDSLDVNLADQANRIINSFPSPAQMAAMLKRAGAPYDANLLNPDANVANYQTTVAKALNLGVYSADLAYANLNEQRQVALKYLSAVRRLAQDLGLDGIFGQSLENRVRANEQHQDSLVAIFAETLADIKTRLHENQQPQILNFMFAGGFVEGLHLALGLYKTKPSEELATQIGEQKINLESLLEYLEPFKAESGFAPIHAKLLALKAAYAEVAIEYTAPAAEAPAPASGVVHVQNRNTVRISPEAIGKIREALAPLRASIVQ